MVGRNLQTARSEKFSMVGVSEASQANVWKAGCAANGDAEKDGAIALSRAVALCTSR